MRIGLVVYGDIRTLTGGYLYDRKLVQHLEGRGHTARILPLPVRGYAGRLTDNFSKARARIAKSTFDLLLQDELCHPSLLRFNRKREMHGRMPVVTVVHHAYCEEERHPWLNRLFGVVERRYLDTVDGFVFNSRTSRKTIQRLSPMPRPHVIAPPGGDRLGAATSPDAAKAAALRPGALELLFLGSVIPRKGLLPLVEALKDVSRDRWQLEVVGSAEWDAGYAARVRRRIRALGLDAQVSFKGVLADRVLADKIASADLLCMPFAYEGFGIVTLEALAFGVPVVGSTRGTTPELIRHGENGFLVAPGDRKAVAAAIDRYYDDREMRLRMRETAFSDFQRHPTWEASMGRVADFLESLVSRQERIR